MISDVKWGPKKASLTTAKLQLSEACALVESLPKWTVVEKVRLSNLHICHLFMSGNAFDDTKFVNNNFICANIIKQLTKTLASIGTSGVCQKFVKITHYTVHTKLRSTAFHPPEY